MAELCPRAERLQERDPNLAWEERQGDTERALRSAWLEGVYKDEH